jgi:hypothetical protein
MFPNIEIKISKYATIGNIALGLWYGASNQPIDVKQFDKGVVHELAKPYHRNKAKTKLFWELLGMLLIANEISSDQYICEIIEEKVGKSYVKYFENALIAYEKDWRIDKDCFLRMKELVLEDIDFEGVVKNIQTLTKAKWERESVTVFIARFYEGLFDSEVGTGHTIPSFNVISILIDPSDKWIESNRDDVTHSIIHELIHINTDDAFNLEWIEENGLWDIIADKIVPDFIANELLVGIGKPSKISKDIFEEFGGVLVPTGYFVDVDQVEIIIKEWFKEFIQSDKKYDEGLKELFKRIDKLDIIYEPDFVKKTLSEIG